MGTLFEDHRFLRHQAFEAADRAVRGTAILELIRRGETILASQLAQLPEISDMPSAHHASETARVVARESRSSVVVAAAKSAEYAASAYIIDAAHDAIYAAEVAAERGHRLSHPRN